MVSHMVLSEYALNETYFTCVDEVLFMSEHFLLQSVDSALDGKQSSFTEHPINAHFRKSTKKYFLLTSCGNSLNITFLRCLT